MLHLTDKEKLNFITHYFYAGYFEYENNLIIAENCCHLHIDKNNVLELYKCQVEKDVFAKISSDIEKILFD